MNEQIIKSTGISKHLYLLSWIKDAISAGNYRENEAGNIAGSSSGIRLLNP
jgi:hypothetical protein